MREFKPVNNNTMDVNKIILVGTLAARPKIETTKNGNRVAALTVITIKKWRSLKGEWNQDKEYHAVVAWRENAKEVEFMLKGQRIRVEGSLKSERWKFPNGMIGKRVYVVAANVERIN